MILEATEPFSLQTCAETEATKKFSTCTMSGIPPWQITLPYPRISHALVSSIISIETGTCIELRTTIVMTTGSTHILFRISSYAIATTKMLDIPYTKDTFCNRFGFKL